MKSLIIVCLMSMIVLISCQKEEIYSTEMFKVSANNTSGTNMAPKRGEIACTIVIGGVNTIGKRCAYTNTTCSVTSTTCSASAKIGSPNYYIESMWNDPTSRDILLKNGAYTYDNE